MDLSASELETCLEGLATIDIRCRTSESRTDTLENRGGIVWFRYVPDVDTFGGESLRPAIEQHWCRRSSAIREWLCSIASDGISKEERIMIGAVALLEQYRLARMLSGAHLIRHAMAWGVPFAAGPPPLIDAMALPAPLCFDAEHGLFERLALSKDRARAVFRLTHLEMNRLGLGREDEVQAAQACAAWVKSLGSPTIGRSREVASVQGSEQCRK